MKFLLDTHALFWAVEAPELLSDRVRLLVQSKNSAVFISVASAWEIAIKVGNGKWPEAEPLLLDLDEQIEVAGFRLLPISVKHVRAAGLLSSPNRNPFDRLLSAQATLEDLTLITTDAKMASLGANILW